MKQKMFYRSFFILLGIYDFLLGLVFALFYPVIYNHFKIVLPNHPAYIQLIALFLMSAAVGNFLIARNILKNTDLVIVRILMKASFAFVVFFNYFAIGIPTFYLPIASMSIIGIVICLVSLKWANNQTKSGE
jgi:hypothetical protein